MSPADRRDLEIIDIANPDGSNREVWLPMPDDWALTDEIHGTVVREFK